MANGNQNQYDMIGMPLASICGDLANLTSQLGELCQCLRNFAQQPGVMPCGQYPLFFKGSIAQTLLCHQATSVFQVPRGQTATITRIALTERYPGTLYGANLMLLVNDNFSPSMPRMDHSMGSLQTGLGTRICLEEQDIVSIMIQCSWYPVAFTGQESTYVETLFPFEIEGFFEYKQVQL